MEASLANAHLQRIVDDMLDTSRDVIFRTREHKWELLSASWTELSGYGVDESLGRDAIDFIHPEDRGGFTAAVDAMYRGELVTRSQVRLVTKQGDVRTVVFQGALVRDQDGRVIGVTGVAHDQTSFHVQSVLRELECALDGFVLRGCPTRKLAQRICKSLASSMPYPLVWLTLGELHVDACAGDATDIAEADLLALGAAARPGGTAVDVSELADASCAAKLASAGIVQVAVLPVATPSGRRGVLGIGVRSRVLGGEHLGALASFTGRLGLVLQLGEHQALLAIQSAAVATSLGAILILDAKGNVEWANAAFERMSGLKSVDIVGRPAVELRPERMRTPAALEDIEATLRAGKVWTGEVLRERDNGEEYVTFERVTPLLDERGRTHHYVVAQEDVTVRRRAQALAEQIARNDRLTDLANRPSFEEHLALGLARARRSSKPTAVLFVDLDRFKLINDTLGRAVGDAVLIEAATRIRTCIREDDVVARFGGDEFTVVLPSCDEVGATRAATEILARLAEPMHVVHHEISVTASVGIAVSTPATDAETLIKEADAAMYQAKALGRNAFAFFTSELAATSARALAIKEGLRRALTRGDELVLHYQPQISAGDEEILGVEALLRWTSPELGVVSPAEFIPIAEQSGLIADIDRWAMMAACAQAKSWLDGGVAVPRVSVNVSGVSFRQGHLVETIERALARTQLPPELLEVELTEGIMLHDAAKVIATLDAVRARGVRIALDDFGTGYSSLGYLKRFKLDALKIDRSFVTGLPHDADSAAIARLIVAMATTLRMEPVAEGVETAEQAAFLASIGCRAFQGFLFSRALPPNELEAFVRQRAGVRPPTVGSGTARAA